MRNRHGEWNAIDILEGIRATSIHYGRRACCWYEDRVVGSRIFSAGPGDIYRRQKAAMEEEEVAQRWGHTTGNWFAVESTWNPRKI